MSLDVDNRSRQMQRKKSRNHGVFCRRLTRTPLPTTFPNLENVFLWCDSFVMKFLYFPSKAVLLRLTPGDSLRSLFLGCLQAQATFARLVRWQFGCGNWHLDRMSKIYDVSLIHHWFFCVLPRQTISWDSLWVSQNWRARKYVTKDEPASFVVLVHLVAWCPKSSLCEHSIRVVKLPRAHGGCLGIRRLWRARKAAKSLG